MQRGLRRWVLMIVALALAAVQSVVPAVATTGGERVRPDIPEFDVVVGSVSYPTIPSEGTERATASSTVCTIVIWELVRFLNTQMESDVDQTCTGWVSQRIEKQNFQRHRWYGWQTIEWNEPATLWLWTNAIDNKEDDVCWSGTWTYRGIARGQFKEAGTTYTSGYVVSNTLTFTC